MKRKLILLCISFLVLIGTCLYYPHHNRSMLVALIVELAFLIHYITLKPADNKKMAKQDGLSDSNATEITLLRQGKEAVPAHAEIE
jgi:uncharacterized membrane protein YozB (DUF420 family)